MRQMRQFECNTVGPGSMKWMPRRLNTVAITVILLGVAIKAHGFGLGERVPNVDALGRTLRWDAANFVEPSHGKSRSLMDGLEVGLPGGNVAGLRGEFRAASWKDGVVPTAAELEAQIEAAFKIWEPSTVHPDAAEIDFKLGNTPIVRDSADGAEIDFYIEDLAAGLQGRTTVQSRRNRNVRLTSGIDNYPSATIAGVDLRLDQDNKGDLWTLDTFRQVLKHELGHALGFGEADLDGIAKRFFDPDATLNNAMSINRIDPNNGMVAREYDARAFRRVDILMESNGALVDVLAPDDAGGRAFLYPRPAVPEPSTWVLLALGLAILRNRARRPS